MRSPRYEAVEETLHVPVEIDELDRYLNAGGRPFGRDRKIRHFLWRVRVTLSSQSSDLLNLRRTIERLQVQQSRVGTPTTLSPVDALKFASPEEISQVVDRLSQRQLSELQRLVTNAQAQHTALTADLAKVRGAANAIINRVDLPASVRTEFARMLAQLPTDVPAVEVPHALTLAAAIESQQVLPALPATPVKALPAIEALPQYHQPPSWTPPQSAGQQPANPAPAAASASAPEAGQVGSGTNPGP